MVLSTVDNLLTNVNVMMSAVANWLTNMCMVFAVDSWLSNVNVVLSLADK